MPKIDRKEIETKVKEVLAKELGVNIENITNDKKLIEDLGMDSFNAIEITFALESIFGISIPDEEIKNVKVVSDIVEYITQRIISEGLGK